MKKITVKSKLAEMSLEQTIFFLIAIAEILMSSVGAVTNMPLGLGAITSVILFANVLLNIGCIIYSVKTKKWFVPSIIVVTLAIFVILPILWFSTGGATGSTLPYLIMDGFIATILFKKKLRNFFIISIPLLYSSFIYLELLYPDIYVPYATREAHYVDLIIGLIVSFAVTAMLAILVLSRYHKSRLESEKLVKKLGEISVTDPLTGIYNRRMLTSCLDEEMRKCYDGDIPLAVCIIDIDFFKRVNDVYGHLRGDNVLIELAKLLEAFMGENDILGRYGGEEFLIIFKNQTLREALQTVRKLHAAVQEHEWETVGRITVSCGVYGYAKGITYSDFVGGADKCLYEAKESGRNKIVYKGA